MPAFWSMAMLPVPAGGLAVERVPEVVGFYGRDVMLLIGGSLLAAGDRLFERARAFVDLVARQDAPPVTLGHTSS